MLMDAEAWDIARPRRDVVGEVGIDAPVRHATTTLPEIAVSTVARG